MRILGIIIIILGLVGVVFGILFLPMANSAEQQVADSIAPNLTIDQVDATYDQLDAAVRQIPQSDPSYLPTYANKVGIGLAKANLGTAKLVRYLGIMNLCLGVGIAAAGIVLVAKK
jgi:hypothetical protein